MQTNPKNEQELRNMMILPPGTYDFEVVDAKDAVSKKGNEMIALNLRVFPKDGGHPRLIRDWLVGGSAMGDLKINRFCHCVGIQDLYFAGELTALDCQNQAGTLHLTVTSSDQYGDQNAVKDYAVVTSGRMADDDPEPPKGVPASQTKAANRKAKQEQPVSDDDIPF